LGALLLDCEACSKQYSKKAPACPNCGKPNELILQSVPSNKNTTTIEQTSKKYKKALIIGIALIAVGFGVIGSIPGLGVILVTIGLVAFLYSRVGAWWNNW
jgi:uncharacterized membrane protein YvbJ